MNDTGDSGDLFTIRNQFYTGQYNKVKGYFEDQFPEHSRIKVAVFKIRSLLSMGEDASSLIDESRSKYPDNEDIFQLLSAWNDLQTFGTEDSTYFDDIKTAEFELQAVLLSLYLVTYRNDIETAISTLTTYIDNNGTKDTIEPFMILVHLYLISGKTSLAKKVYKDLGKFSDSVKDDIIYQYIEAWMLALDGTTESVSNSYYFYDEILSSDFEENPHGKLKILNALFTLSLQLNHYPEAEELFKQIKQVEGNDSDPTFIANQITYDYLTNNGAQREKLLEQLSLAEAGHDLLRDLKKRDEIFDSIVEKYRVKS